MTSLVNLCSSELFQVRLRRPDLYMPASLSQQIPAASPLWGQRVLIDKICFHNVHHSDYCQRSPSNSLRCNLVCTSLCFVCTCSEVMTEYSSKYGRNQKFRGKGRPNQSQGAIYQGRRKRQGFVHGQHKAEIASPLADHISKHAFWEIHILQSRVYQFTI